MSPPSSGTKNKPTRNQREASSKQSPEMEATFPPKRRLTFNGLHGVISQRIELFIISALRNSKSYINILV
jgi:hypothetical protein